MAESVRQWSEYMNLVRRHNAIITSKHPLLLKTKHAIENFWTPFFEDASDVKERNRKKIEKKYQAFKNLTY